jgi:hypothetical protein
MDRHRIFTLARSHEIGERELHGPQKIRVDRAARVARLALDSSAKQQYEA